MVRDPVLWAQDVIASGRLPTANAKLLLLHLACSCSDSAPYPAYQAPLERLADDLCVLRSTISGAIKTLTAARCGAVVKSTGAQGRRSSNIYQLRTALDLGPRRDRYRLGPGPRNQANA